jgi:SAM-dependent methyltransferase
MGGEGSIDLAKNLTESLYELSELEFFYPHQDFTKKREETRKQIDLALKLDPFVFQKFVLQSAALISSLCNDPTRSSGALYRAFDSLDELLAIDYQETREQVSQHKSLERLYDGGGVGVQTSYSTIFRALHSLQLPLHAHIVDLGCGYGRVGLATGLWRSDLRFTGYEFVAHRVDSAKRAATIAGIDARVQFICQDLSDPAFEIPAADVFYLYDPFSQSTYKRICSRIAELCSAKTVIVIAKAGARDHFKDWFKLDELDDGTLSVFRSE